MSEHVLTFHRSLYTLAAVRAAAAAYAGLAEIRVDDENEHELRVTLTPTEPVDDLADGFANHVLFETVAARRA